MRNIFFLGAALLIAGCGEAPDHEPVDAVHDELEVVIERVPNPPLASDLANLPGDLSTVTVPEPTNLADFVADKNAAIALGKALFWDMQVGSDRMTACATCHFRAGADPRSKNQLSPGLKHAGLPDLNFFKKGPNAQLLARDFPLTRLAVPGTRGALDLATDNNDAVASQGVPYLLEGVPDTFGFAVSGLKTRRVEPRNTPSVINAVFNHRQFWDGRAENVFNGVNHAGDRDPNAKVVRAESPSSLFLVPVRLENASLASQAVAPLLNDIEMSAPGRTMQELARSLRSRRPLARQQVHPNDSVLGPLSRYPEKGLKAADYEELIRKAFQPQWWNSSKKVRIRFDGSIEFVSPALSGKNDWSVLEYNFALFFGLAVQLYEATLVSAETPWDQFRRQHPLATDPALNPWTNTNPGPISRLALFGAHLFNDRTRGPTNTRCSNCHEQAELTDASNQRVRAALNGPVRNRDGNIIDKGFNNIGVRPTVDDLGAGGSDALGPLSAARRLFPNAAPTEFDGAVVSKGFGVDGAFKVPSLRNVALTAPYFHNGDASTLKQVVEFYSRGGNVAPVLAQDGVVIEPLGVPSLAAKEVNALVEFLKALTDERVLYQRAPFDHPQLFVPNGHKGNATSVDDDHGLAKDDVVELSAVGAAGSSNPIPGFLEGVFGPKN